MQTKIGDTARSDDFSTIGSVSRNSKNAKRAIFGEKLVVAVKDEATEARPLKVCPKRFRFLKRYGLIPRILGEPPRHSVPVFPGV